MAVRIVPIVVLALIAVLAQLFLVPRMTYLGVIPSKIPDVNTGSCKQVPGLEACEDQWIHRASGISYLPCSSIKGRALWLPAVEHFNGTVDKILPSDTIKMYDLNTGSISTITIANRPSHLEKLHLHAIEAFIDPKDDEKLTFFINNHAVPKGIAKEGDEKKVGADSTIEIFETRLGSKTWTWVQSVKHPSILTPNNMVALGPRKFYVTNDHHVKTGFSRTLCLFRFPGTESGIIYCDASSSSSLPSCKAVADGYYHPNGLAKGPGSTLYMASTFDGFIKSFDIQADYSLVENEQVADIGRPIDNIDVNEVGEITAAVLPNAIQFTKRVAQGYGDAISQVWKVSNDTSDQRFYGKHHKQTLIYSDSTGKLSPTTTNAQLYKGKLYMAGLSGEMVVCEGAEAFKAGA